PKRASRPARTARKGAARGSPAPRSPAPPAPPAAAAGTPTAPGACPAPPPSPLPPPPDHVQQHRQDHDAADDRPLPKGGVLLDDQVDAVEDDVQDGGPQRGAEEGPLAALEAAAADHRGGDRVQLVAGAAPRVALPIVADVED